MFQYVFGKNLVCLYFYNKVDFWDISDSIDSDFMKIELFFDLI